MLELKIAITGLIILVVSSLLIRVVGKYPGPVVGMPLVFAWFCGLAMAISGFIAAIWV